MALQQTGQISLTDIGNEMGDTTGQRGIGEYVGKGSVPTFNVSFSGFYGFSVDPDITGISETNTGVKVNNRYPAGTTVQLSATVASASIAVQSGTTGYTWSRVSGPSVTIQNSTSQSCYFTAPQVNSDDNVVVKCVVRDSQGDTDELQFTVPIKAYSQPLAPQIDVTGQAYDSTIGLNVVQPNGNIRYRITNAVAADPVSGVPVTYKWSVTDPSGAFAIASGAKSSFNSTSTYVDETTPAPEYDPSADFWTLTFTATVTDSFGGTASVSTNRYIKRKQRVLDFVRLADRAIGKRSSTTQSTPQPFLPTSIQEGDVMIVMATYSTDDTGIYDHPLHGQSTNSSGEVTGIPTMISSHGFENLMASYDYGRDLPWDSAGKTENSLDYMTPTIAGPYLGISYLAGFWKKITATDVANKGSTLNLFNTGQTWGNEEWHIYVFRTGNTNTPVGGVNFIGSDELFYSRLPRYGTSNTAKKTIRIYTNSTKTALRYGQGDANDKMQTGTYVGKNGVLLVCCASTSQNALYPSKHTSDSQMTNHYYGWWESSIDQSAGLRDYTTSTTSTWQNNRIYTQAIQSATYARYAGDWYTQYGMRLSTMITQYMGDTTNKYSGLMYSGTDASYNRWYTTTGGYYKDIAIELSQSSSASSGSYFGGTTVTNQDWTAYYGLINIWYDDPLY